MDAPKKRTPRRSVSSDSTSSWSGTDSSTSLLLKPRRRSVYRFADGKFIPVNGRHTWIMDSAGTVIAEIVFGPVHPLAIKVAGAAPLLGKLCGAQIFGEIQDRAGVLVVPTRVEGFEWRATKVSMMLIDSDEQRVMMYHPRARIDKAGRVRSAHLRRGGAFLEIHDRIKAMDEVGELLVTFCLMEIARRGKYGLVPYVHTDGGALSRYGVIVRKRMCGAIAGLLGVLGKG